MFRTTGIIRALLYSELDEYSERWYPGIMYIPNPRHIQHPFKHPRWSALRKELTAIIIFTDYYFCNISFSRSLPHEKISWIFSIQVSFLVQKYLFYVKSMGPRVGGREVRYTSYQTPKMELFAEMVNGYFHKKLHLMFEICLKGFWIRFCITWKHKQPFKRKGKWLT